MCRRRAGVRAGHRANDRQRPALAGAVRKGTERGRTGQRCGNEWKRAGSEPTRGERTRVLRARWRSVRKGERVFPALQVTRRVRELGHHRLERRSEFNRDSRRRHCRRRHHAALAKTRAALVPGVIYGRVICGLLRQRVAFRHRAVHLTMQRTLQRTLQRMRRVLGRCMLRNQRSSGACVRAVTRGDGREARMHRARQQSGRLSERGRKPHAPKGDEAAEPEGASHATRISAAVRHAEGYNDSSPGRPCASRPPGNNAAAQAVSRQMPANRLDGQSSRPS